MAAVTTSFSERSRHPHAERPGPDAFPGKTTSTLRRIDGDAQATLTCQRFTMGQETHKQRILPQRQGAPKRGALNLSGVARGGRSVGDLGWRLD